jgi:hypothetical protein
VEQWIIPVVTALISTMGAFVSVWYGRRAALGERLASAEDLALRFREPLLQAVFNLETRIYNIVELDFFGRFMGPESTEDEREYAVLNTLYVVAQYLCWVEILRRESQFVDPRDSDRNRAAVHSLEAVRDTFADSRSIKERSFRLFRGEQRALGEVMLVKVIDPQPGVPRWECLGYAPFVRALDDEQVARWFTRLRADIARTASDLLAQEARLRLVQRGLMDIIDVLDPEARRVPSRLRRRLDPPAA